ncbi:MAG: hypothetical protein AAB368_12490, partial [bacterium]
GMIRWYDTVSHIMGQLKGVSINGLLRYFDTNTYFRQPHVTGALAAKGPLLAEDLKWARAVSSKPVIAYLPGPLTLANLSLIKGASYADTGQLMNALVPILADEVERLAQAGADAIVVDEPYLLRKPAGFSELADALEVLAARKGAIRMWLFPSCGNAAPLYDKLQRLTVDGLILDFTYGKELGDVVASAGSQLLLGLGLVDARNTKLESPARVAKEAARLLKKARGGLAGLVPSNGLEYLPRTRAAEKLAVLAKARDLLNGTSRSGRRPVKAKRAAPKRRAAKAGRKPARGRGKR